MAGIMGNFEVSGSQVHELIFQENNLAKVNSIAKNNVLNTYWLFLKFELLQKGMLQMNDYLANLSTNQKIFT